MSATRGKVKQTGKMKDNSPRRAPSSSKKGGGKEEDKMKYFCRGGSSKTCKKRNKKMRMTAYAVTHVESGTTTCVS